MPCVEQKLGSLGTVDPARVSVPTTGPAE